MPSGIRPNGRQGMNWTGSRDPHNPSLLHCPGTFSCDGGGHG